ncbi:hypothetical protein ACP70R_023400 [Stipagrostis hirtigluma subsp. patula]
MASTTSISTAPADRSIRAATTCNDGELHSDMLREVLLRLPARQLCRLRAVCRAWRSLISDPAFVAAHASRHPGPLVAVGVIAGKFGGMVELVLLDMSGNIRKRVPAGGLRHEAKMLTHGHLAAMALDGQCLRVRVVDMESGAVSLVPDRIQVEHASDPRSQATGGVPVLGRAASGEHKLLRISRKGRDDQVCHVATIGGGGGGGWTERPAPPVPVFLGHGRAVVVDGIAYFLVQPARNFWGGARHDFDEPDGIASFDLATEQWSPTILRGPVSSCTDDTAEHTAGYESRFQLTALNGRLVVIHRNVDHCSMDLWFRTGCSSDEGRAPWHRRYVIRYDSEEARRLAGAVDPLWELDDGRLAVWCLFSGGYGRLHKVLRTYDPSTNAFADVKEIEEECVGVGVYTGDILSSY